MEGAEAQTRLRGASPPTRVLKTHRERQTGERVNAWSFFFSSSLVDGCCCVCLLCLFLSTSLSGCTDIPRSTPAWSFTAGGLFLSVTFSVFSLLLHYLFLFCSPPSAPRLLFPSLSASASRSILHFVPSLLSTELGDPSCGHLYCSERTLKCQRDWGWLSVFITLSISDSDNNAFDLNSSKGNINIPFLYSVLF